MMSYLLQTIHVDDEWVAREYLWRCKAGAWKKENTAEALKCWNLERILDAKVAGTPPPPHLTLEDLL